MQDFRNLKVWKKSHKVVMEVYKLTKAFPKEELFGLSSQMRRSAVSIPSNIAEGCCRSSDAEFSRFLFIASGSASELDYQLLLSKDLEYIDELNYKKTSDSLNDVKRMLAALITRLKAES